MKQKKFNGKAEVHEIEGNTGENFTIRRRGHFGGSDAPVLLGDSEYISELEGAAKKAGIVSDSNFAKKTLKIFAQGHEWEESIAKLCTEFMHIDTGFDIELHSMDKYEWTNEEWPDALGHLDFIIKVKKGRVIENPDFHIGSGKYNWKIIPDPEDHNYVCDSKTCQDEFVPTWNERNNEGVRIGGLANGVCPKPYWEQLHVYMAVCNIDGGFIFGSLGRNKVSDYAIVYVPYVPQAGQTIMDECQRTFSLLKAGKLPKVRDCKDRTKAALFLDKLYPTVNQHMRLKKLTDNKWSEPFEQVAAIDSEIDIIKAGVAEATKAVRAAEAQIEKLRLQKKALLLEPVEAIKNRKGCYYTDDNGNTYVIEYMTEMKWDYLTKEYFAEHAPDVYAEAEKIFSQRKIRFAKHSAVKENFDDEDEAAEYI